MAGVIVVTLLAAMACSWLARVLLLRMLRDNHPEEFAALGQPSTRQLESILPRYQEMNLQFWKYLWGERVLALGDFRVAGLAWFARLADTILAFSVVAFFWSASQ